MTTTAHLPKTPQARSCPLEITAEGSLRLGSAVAARFFPDDALVVLCGQPQQDGSREVLLLPTRGAAGGGLILKQRNVAGDRSVLVAEPFGFAPPVGQFNAVWDESRGGLLLQLGGGPLLQRPQPVGIFSFPASHLLLPASDDSLAPAAAQRLLLGDASGDLPETWAFFAAAAAEDLGEAVGLLPVDDLVSRYNRFVLDPTTDAFAELRGSGEPVIARLAEAAACAHGLVDQIGSSSAAESDDPAAAAVSAELPGELAAMLLLTAATLAMEAGDTAAAAAQLEQAVAAAEPTSPVLAALLLLQQAELMPAAEVGVAVALKLLDRAAALAAEARLPLLQAELWMRRGLRLQELGAGGSRQAVLEAIECYQQALASGIDAGSAADWFGQIQNNLGLAYLTTPGREASDQLRCGIAVQSFRKALEIFTREADPGMWASVSMNLASSLQYLPSTHPGENLAEAVELYEQVLAVRTAEADPVTHARVLLNQANALAHLGIFAPAREKLATAAELFERHGLAGEAEAAAELLREIDSAEAADPAAAPSERAD